MGMPKWTRECLGVFNPTRRTIGTWGKLRAGEVAFLGEGHTNWQSKAKWSTLKHKDINITQTIQLIFRSVCACVNLCLRGMNYGYLKSWNCLPMRIFEAECVLNY